MPQSNCTICTHPEAEQIDRDIVAGRSMRKIAVAYGLNAMSVHNHKQRHLSPALKQAKVETEDRHEMEFLSRVEAMVADVEEVVTAAKAEGKPSLVLAAVDRLEKVLRLLGNATGALKGDGATIQVLNVQTSTEWVAIRSVMLEALAPFPEARAAIAEALSAGEPQPIKVLQAGVITPYRPEEPHGGPYAPPGEDE